MYREIIKYIFDNDNIYIRTIVARNKNSLVFENNQQYDIWYYKILYQLIHVPVENIFNQTIYGSFEEKLATNISYSLFLDRKNSQSTSNAKKLTEVLGNTYYGFFDFNYNICDSKEFPLIQVIDLFIGAISYKCRNLSGSGSVKKIALIQYIESLFDINLNESTSKNARKFNNFIWQGRGGER